MWFTHKRKIQVYGSYGKTIITGMSMELSNDPKSKLGDFTYLGDVSNLLIYIYIKWILWKIDGSYGKKTYPGSPTTIFKSGSELRVSP